MNGDKSGLSDVIRILTVDDHPLLREGIAGLVADQSDMRLVAEASNGREAIQQFRTHRPDVTLMDLQMPDMNRNKQVASHPGLGEEAVNGRFKTIVSRLGANDRTHAAMIGIKRGIIEF